MKRSRLRSFLNFSWLALLVSLVASCSGVPLLDPKGPVGNEEKFLILISLGLMLIVVVPVLVLTFWFSVHYRASNKKATFKPNWEGSPRIEAVVWLIPFVIVAILSFLTIKETGELDPYRPIASSNPALKVEVVSLDWNWLFIYPEYEIASINKLIVPVGTPISFDLTSASVMTSFFIPQLGSQMYAMPGMVTHLNLLASETGTYQGQNQEFSGDGYVTMHFPVKVETKEAFDVWVRDAKAGNNALDTPLYAAMSSPQINYPAASFSSVEPGLFDHLVGRFRGWIGDSKMPGGQATNAETPTVP